MKFRSRISVALVFFVLVMGTLPFAAFGTDDQIIQFYIVPLLVIGLTIALLAGISYEIRDKQLLVKMFGITSIKIDIMSIHSVNRSYNPLSSPAGSLKRLHVKASKTSVLISPVREKEFIDQLSKINPNIQVVVTEQPDWYRFWDWDI